MHDTRISHVDQSQARQRLDARFRDTTLQRYEYSVDDAVSAVTLAMDFPDSPVRKAPVRVEDLADAALLLDQARDLMEIHLAGNELRVLDALRAEGWSWQQLGEHLGYPRDAAARRARARFDRLRKLLPGFELRSVVDNPPG